MKTDYAVNAELRGEFAWLNNHPVFASISGGKDSTALGLFLKEKNIEFTPVFLDTGWEHSATYDYIRDVLTPMFGDFVVLRNEKFFEEDPTWKGGMEQMIRREKMFPSGKVKFCTRLLKIVPIQNFYAEIRCAMGVKPVNALGIRSEESFARSSLSEVEEQDEATIWRPLISWKEQEIIEKHHFHSVPPNPLYLKGYLRVGCYPCIYMLKHEIRHMALSDPERVDYIEELEERVNTLRGEKKEALTFFSSKIKGERMSIREITEWSMIKKRENKKYVLDDQESIEEGGCMRWGFCEPIQGELF